MTHPSNEEAMVPRSQPPQPTGDSWQPMETAPKGIPTENVGCRGASEWFVGRSSPDGNPIIRRRAWPHEDSWEDRNGTTYRPRYFDGWCPLAPTAQPTGDVGELVEAVTNIEGMLAHNPDEKALRFHVGAECRKLRALIGTADSRTPASAWQPISTAPKDQTSILLAGGTLEDGVAMGMWYRGEWRINGSIIPYEPALWMHVPRPDRPALSPTEPAQER